MQRLGEHRGEAVAGEGPLADEAGEEDAAEREHVGRGAHLGLAARLLRRHVADGADRHAVERELAVDQRGPGDAEVEQGRLVEARRPLARPRDQDVPRLDVAMHQPPPVRVRQRRGDPRTQLQRRRQIDLPALEDLAERLPLDPVHHQVGQASLGDAARDVAGHRQPPRCRGSRSRGPRSARSRGGASSPGAPPRGRSASTTRARCRRAPSPRPARPSSRSKARKTEPMPPFCDRASSRNRPPRTCPAPSTRASFSAIAHLTARARSEQLLALRRGEDPQHLAVLRHRAAGDLDAVASSPGSPRWPGR